MTVTVTLPKLDPLQWEVLSSSARFKQCPWGRRCGKSHVGSTAGLQTALESVGGAKGVAWWVWPTHKLGRTGWVEVLRPLAQPIVRGIQGARIYEVERAISIPGGGELQMRSAEDPGSLVGSGLSRVIIDEAGMIQSRAWDESLRPALMDKEGDAIFLGTPKGRGGLFWECERRANDDAQPQWKRWHRTVLESPWISDAEKIEVEDQYRRGYVTERYWRQEYMAEFLSDAGSVFRRVMEAATATPQEEAKAGHTYVFGVDWGKAHDFTVIAVWDVDEQALVCVDRFNKEDYALQLGRLQVLYDKFHPIVVKAERNSMGDPLVEQLQRIGLPVEPFLTTSATKNAAVEGLALSIERGDCTIIPDPTLVGELQSFERGVTGTGIPKYGAPSGMHDDTVIAACIGWTGASQGQTIDLAWV